MPPSNSRLSAKNPGVSGGFLFDLFLLQSISYLERVLVLQVQRVTGELRATTALALDKEAVLVAYSRSIELARAERLQYIRRK